MTAFLAALLLSSAQTETVKIPDSEVRFDLVRIPGGGASRLGPYWLGAREVTWEEYSLYYESYRKAKVDGVTRPSQPDVIDPKEPFPNGEAQGPTHPAISIGWYGAMGYCEWLSKKTGRKFRLPTELEYELAASADGAPADEAAWHAGNSGKNSHIVGMKKPNALGLFDVLGNAWENCLEPAKPPAWSPVVRGGGWNSPAKDLAATLRAVVPDEWAERDPKRPLRLWWLTDGNFVGFRVLRVEGDGGKDAEAALRKFEIKDLKIAKAGKRPDYLDRVTGTLSYTGDSVLDEVELVVHFIDEDGSVMMKDPKDKPAFNVIYPVLAHSVHEGDVRKPLKPGESRAFELDVPHPFLETGPLDLGQVGARVTYVRTAK
jgi:formylglycine-generating enzyme required for sulfatase activity